jgi:hypothetical protein
MSVKQVILHIGSPKCGSTALQLFLYKNRDNLKLQGYDYQFFEPNSQDWRISRGFTGGDIWNPIYPKMDGSLEATPLQTQMLKSVFDQATEQLKSCNSLLISNEFLYFMSQQEKFWMMCEDFSKSAGAKISIVMYLRNPFDFLFSWYSESVKRGFTLNNFSNYLLSTNPIFDSIYSELPQLLKNSDEFGVPISFFGPQDYRRDITSHFIEFCGIDAYRFLQVAPANMSLSLLELEFFRGVHSKSRELGYVFCYDATDFYLNSINLKKVNIKLKPRITLSSAESVAENLLRIKRELIELHPTFAALNYEIPASFLLPPFDSEIDELLTQAFEIGVFCGRSYKSGYLERRLK